MNLRQAATSATPATASTVASHASLRFPFSAAAIAEIQPAFAARNVPHSGFRERFFALTRAVSMVLIAPPSTGTRGDGRVGILRKAILDLLGLSPGGRLDGARVVHLDVAADQARIAAHRLHTGEGQVRAMWAVNRWSAGRGRLPWFDPYQGGPRRLGLH